MRVGTPPKRLKHERVPPERTRCTLWETPGCRWHRGMGQWKKDLLVLLSESLHSINNNRQTTVVALRGIDSNVAVSTKACYQLNSEEGESVLFEI
ncbi:hypothetical protein Mal48_03750 [Thalassoglobus polymorphus]|uniref:Uncharacterized protein n=1 Tax=Thalassoglobus polymorphus TaxID=2527994 RepID=A0A517QHN2_9PLAN|nr:hypothetical protein Mal48_03750 [Thalassoglobus polymorphus]